LLTGSTHRKKEQLLIGEQFDFRREKSLPSSLGEHGYLVSVAQDL
jgi:hypothetical protein